MADNSERKLGVLSLGCPRNLVDTENIVGGLTAKGYSVVEMDNAETALVNTCAFIDEAKRESIDAILSLVELKKQGRLKKIVVYGCLAQRYGDALRKELPEVDAFVGKISLNHSKARFPISPKHFVYLKICESCLNHCSFCVIPKIKGKFSSLNMRAVLSKAEELDRQKPSEINIIGQDTSAWGMDLYGALRLPKLLKSLAGRLKNTGWVRLLYLYPSRLSDDLLKVIRDEPKICKYIDLPIQHVNARILKLMRRSTSTADILRAIEKVRKTIPAAAIRTSVIAGFPSETEKEFSELLDFLREARFERLGAFIYSREEGTAAYNFKKQLPRKIKIERFERIMSLQQEISREFNVKFIGKTIDVLIDDSEDGDYLGRTEFDAPEVDGTVFVKSIRTLKPGDFVKAKITDTLEYDLVGEA